MNGFIKSCQPLLKRLKLKKYLLEILLLVTAVIITIIALTVYTKSNQDWRQEIEASEVSQTTPTSANKIFIDISGAVKKPNVYQVRFGARLKEVIDASGGISDEADVTFFNRNFNLAQIVTDQEKIYIPSIIEINNGMFVNYVSPTMGVINDAPTTSINNQLINLNSATIEELDQLPGVGQVTANKIISGRPYKSLEELSVKKIVNKNVFEKIKSLISL